MPTKKMRDDLTAIPEDAKTMVASTLVKNFISMPQWLRWSVVIALIIGSFYFLVIQKFVNEYKESTQIEQIQVSVNDMSKKVKFLEDDHIDALSVYEDLEDVMEIFSLMDAVDKKRVKNYMKFVKKTHPSEEYQKMLREFEEEERKIDGEYYEALEKIFNDRVKNRIKKKHSRDP